METNLGQGKQTVARMGAERRVVRPVCGGQVVVIGEKWIARMTRVVRTGAAMLKGIVFGDVGKNSLRGK